ncbi:MAG TPA: dihydroorotase [Chitinophagaceae bacterium]|nr:dihydroorotase [Chitinophagaceae bacterium]
MKFLIKQARVVDPSSPFNGQTTDLFIENGILSKIGNPLSEEADQVISLPGLQVSPGWMDCFAHFADPGYEFKETLETGAAAAAAGGFTDVLLIPNTNPCIHNKATVEYVVQKSRPLPVRLHPIGAVTRQTEGKELAEMYDMRSSGALAFGDGIHCVQSAGLLVKALQYVKAFGGTVIQLPDDRTIQPHGLINEGIVSTRLGLPGKPAMAEELIVARDIKLARYAESRLHFTGISSARSLEYIQRAKQGGLAISCSVTPYHLFFSDEDLLGYDTNLKVNPPLRTPADRQAIRQAVLDGLVDCLATHHLPHEFDSKVLEFEYAKFGMIGLETAYSVIHTALQPASQELLVNLLAHNPRRLFGLEPVSIRPGTPASLTLFDPAASWTVQEKDIRSKSKNSPFLGKTLSGRVAGIINKDQLFLN